MTTYFDLDQDGLVLATPFVKVYCLNATTVAFVTKEQSEDEDCPYAVQIRFEHEGSDTKLNSLHETELERDTMFDQVDKLVVLDLIGVVGCEHVV